MDTDERQDGFRVMVARLEYGGACISPLMDWYADLIGKLAADPRIDVIRRIPANSTPTDASRNRIVVAALQARCDYLLMLDNDLENHPYWWEAAWRLALDRRSKDMLAVIGAPYCGAPPEEPVLVGRWVDAPNTRCGVRLVRYTRSEAAELLEPAQVATLPAGCSLWDLRCFGIAPPPWFRYEYADDVHAIKLSSEETPLLRDLGLAGCEVWCTWNRWSIHHKDKAVGPPERLSGDAVPEQLRNALALPVPVTRPGSSIAKSVDPGRHRRIRRCDVVLPFRDHTEWVEEALDSLKAQEGAELVVHLIDDASEERAAADALLRSWSAAWPAVRPYRNVEHIGQYFSANNVAGCLESDYLAIQDADDLSTPWRISDSLDLLEQHGADIVGGAMLPFGEELGRPAALRRSKIYSVYPRTDGPIHFVQNPTATIRAEVFRWLGGFAHISEPNRLSADDEFWWRAWAAGCRFVFSPAVWLYYRRHPDQATRSPEIGMGTPIRTEAQTHVRERIELYHQIRPLADPARFGALGAAAGRTQPWKGNGRHA